MKKKVAGAMRAYFDMDAEERAKFIDWLNRYNHGDVEERRLIESKANEGFVQRVTKVQLGPVTVKVCPVCGK